MAVLFLLQLLKGSMHLVHHASSQPERVHRAIHGDKGTMIESIVISSDEFTLLTRLRSMTLFVLGGLSTSAQTVFSMISEYVAVEILLYG